MVHRYIKIWTDKPLKCDYRFHALPDACTYLIFDQLKPDVVGPATLGGKSMEFNLGRIFHYVNIRFFPGVWQSDRVRSFVGQINQSYDGNLPLLAINQELLGQPFDQQLKVHHSLYGRIERTELVFVVKSGRVTTCNIIYFLLR